MKLKRLEEKKIRLLK
jgi:hypothetical protein